MDNVTTDDMREGPERLIDQMENIYSDQEETFKVNVSLGFILRHIETGEYRYFAPNQNETLFPLPSLISSRRSLKLFENKLRSVNLMEHLKKARPNSQWKPYLITNLLFEVTPTNFPLGGGLLPDYIKNAKGLVSLDCDAHNQIYRDGLCFF